LRIIQGCNEQLGAISEECLWREGIGDAKCRTQMIVGGAQRRELELLGTHGRDEGNLHQL
jgi:hypothetical protein